MAETHDEITTEISAPTTRRPRARKQRPAAQALVHTTTRDVISAFTALESASAEAQSKGHPLELRRSSAGKFVASCRRCGMDLPILDTARGWTYPSPGSCPNPLRDAS
jgi:acyl CoA:acetate/3-ketoacid CoA transferase alpha subunit